VRIVDNITSKQLVELLDRTLPVEAEPTVCLATCDLDGPHVRNLSLVRDRLSFYFATSRDSEKMSQLKEHGNVELFAVLRGETKLGSLRVAGTLVEVEGAPLHEAWERAQGYDAKRHFAGGLDDPELIAFRIQPVRVRLRRPGDREVDVPIELFTS